MADPIEKRATPLKGQDHHLEALSLLGNHRPAEGSAEAIAAAQVHATLALAEHQAELARLLEATRLELNASNMFKLADSLADEHPLKGAIRNSMLGHLSAGGAVKTDVMLAVRIRDLGLEIKAGDDIVVADPSGEKSLHLLVVDPDNDEWLQLVEDEKLLDRTVDSMKIHEFFGCEIRSLAVTLKDSPTI